MKKSTIKGLILVAVLLLVGMAIAWFSQPDRGPKSFAEDLSAKVYTIPEQAETGSETISISCKFTTSDQQKGFMSVDGSVALRGDTYNFTSANVDLDTLFYLYKDDGSYFGTMVFSPKTKESFLKDKTYIVPGIGEVAVFIGGDEKISSFSRCKEVLIYKESQEESFAEDFFKKWEIS